MATARDIIKSALRKIHVLGTGSSLDDTEATDALGTLNAMLSSWSAEGSMVYGETRETFSLSSAVSFTIGSGLDINTTAPLFILSAYTTQGNIDYPVTEIDNKEYNDISLKTQGTTYPEYYYYDDNFPTPTIYFYPKPSASTSFTWTAIKPLTSFATLETDFAFPEEYRAALDYNLAVWLAPEYEREASMTVQKIANKTKGVIASQNKRNKKMISSIDTIGGGSDGNVYKGWY